VPTHEDDPLFVPPGKVQNWYILNVCAGKPFHSGLFIDLPYTSFFDDSLRAIFTRSGVLRAVAFSRARSSRTEALRQWWLSNRRHFYRETAQGRLTMPHEHQLVPTPCDRGTPQP
jgi:hypothetical protein